MKVFMDTGNIELEYVARGRVGISIQVARDVKNTLL